MNFFTEKNWFETQQSEMDPNQDEAHHNGETAMPSCPAGSAEGEKICEVCHEPFDQFYNEETEEWHLRPAIRMEEVLYHPICYEDYKLSLTMASMDESVMSEANLGDDGGVDPKKEAVIKTDGEEGVKKEKSTNCESKEDSKLILNLILIPQILHFQWTNRWTMTTM